VADGVTRSRDAEGRYPCPSPAVTAAKIVTEEAIGQFQRAYIGSSWQAAMISIANGFAAANRRIARFAATLPQPDFLSNDLPAAVATIVCVVGLRAVYGHIGDTGLLHIGGDRTATRLTRNQTAGVDSWASRNKEINQDVRLVMVRKKFRNSCGLPQSFGALTGQPSALQWIDYGSAVISPGDMLLLFSDGLSGVFEEGWNDVGTRRRVVDLLETQQLDKILSLAERHDLSRQAVSDDKTLISIKLPRRLHRIEMATALE